MKRLLKWPKSLAFDMARFEGLLNLTDQELMLALCVREKNLVDPSRWCEEMRHYMQESGKGSFTTEGSELLMALGAKLSREAGGEMETSPRYDSIEPEVAAFNAYERAIRGLKG